MQRYKQIESSPVTPRLSGEIVFMMWESDELSNIWNIDDLFRTIKWSECSRLNQTRFSKAPKNTKKYKTQRIDGIERIEFSGCEETSSKSTKFNETIWENKRQKSANSFCFLRFTWFEKLSNEKNTAFLAFVFEAQFDWPRGEREGGQHTDGRCVRQFQTEHIIVFLSFFISFVRIFRQVFARDKRKKNTDNFLGRQVNPCELNRLLANEKKRIGRKSIRFEISANRRCAKISRR